MVTGYAPAKTVYQAVRSAVAPGTKSQRFRRWAGTQAGWQKAINGGQLLDGGTPSLIRQSPFSCCLVRSELDRLARIQGVINRRRPPIPEYLERDIREDSLLGHHLRELYPPTPEYREGELVSFAYYSIQDVHDLVGFIAPVLSEALERFRDGRVAKPIQTTPPHLVPQWLQGRPSP